MDRPKFRTGKASRVSQKQPLGSIPTNSSSTSRSNRRERQSKRGGKSTSPGADLNSKIIALGNKEKWRKILAVFEKEKVSFRNVDYSTVMVQLSKKALLGETENITQDPQFISFLDSLADNIVERGMEWIEVRSVANVIHAFAKMGLCNGSAKRILDWISRDENAEQFIATAEHTQSISIVAWALATLGIPAPAFFAKLDAESDWFVKNADPQGVANVAWAFGKLDTPYPIFFLQLDSVADWFVKNANPQNIANVALACAKLRKPSPAFFLQLDGVADWFVKNSSTQGVANVAWAYAILGHEASTFFSAMEAGINRFVGNANLRHVANVCYAVAVADQFEKSKHMLRTLWERAMQLFSSDVKKVDDESFRQLAQTKLLANACTLDLPVCPEMAKFIEKAMKASSGENNTSSKCATAVSFCLKRMDFEHECEVPPSSDFWGGFLAIDFACKDRKVAIEFDGPFHFLKANDNDTLTTQRDGPTEAKRRLLKLLEWRVVNLDFREFDSAVASGSESEYLRLEFLREGVQLPQMSA